MLLCDLIGINYDGLISVIIYLRYPNRKIPAIASRDQVTKNPFS